MKIAIDARMLGWTGIGRYTSELIKNLAEIDHNNHYLVLLQTKDMGKLSLPDNFEKVVADFRPYGLSEQLGFVSLLRKLAPDLVHFPSFNAPVLYSGASVYTIPDLTLVHYKTNRGNGPGRLLFEAKHLAMRFVLHRSVMKADALITYSETVKNELAELFSVKSAITAIPLAVGSLATSPARPDGVPESFLLYVGNFYPSKNIDKLLEVMQQLPAVQLVIAGKEDYFQNQLKQQVQRLGLGDRVKFTGFVSDAELAWLYQHAALFVFPSLSEGFGLPPLEAMAAGTPVISSNASCMPEVLGDSAAYFDPKDPQDMANKIQALLSDPKELERLRKAGLEHVKQFSWRKMAEQTLAVYKEVLKK